MLPSILEHALPAPGPEAETNTLEAMLHGFDADGQDKRKVDYLRHRYAGFTRKESGKLAGVTITTVNKWLKEDPRTKEADLLVSTGQRQGLRKEVLQEDWFRNFYLVLQRDSYLLRKSHGMLEEVVWERAANGTMVRRLGSPPMQKQDWEYFSQMRKMYTPDAWAAIEKAISKQGVQFNVAEFILNLAQTQQVNVNGAGVNGAGRSAQDNQSRG